MGLRVAFCLADSLGLILILFWGGNVSEGAEQATSAGDEFEEGLGAFIVVQKVFQLVCFGAEFCSHSASLSGVRWAGKQVMMN
jgi:hypothetical protein